MGDGAEYSPSPEMLQLVDGHNLLVIKSEEELKVRLERQMKVMEGILEQYREALAALSKR